jgi:hypothetical protein
MLLDRMHAAGFISDPKPKSQSKSVLLRVEECGGRRIVEQHYSQKTGDGLKEERETPSLSLAA